MQSTLRCPNQRVFQTGQRCNYTSLSESKGYSDRIRWISHLVVRIQGLFGQDTLDFSLRCPNPRLIQTGYVGFLPSLSESKAYSGRTRWNPPFVVRIPVLFRQDTLEFSLRCPNPRVIRTGLKEFALWCPNSRVIQTGYAGILPSLSESQVIRTGHVSLLYRRAWG